MGKLTLIATITSLLLLTVALGCASTRMTSQVNTELLDRRFSKLLVQGNFQNLEHRKLAEDRLCSEIARLSSCACVRSSAVFFPGKDYTTEEIDQRLVELEIDGVLVIQPTGSGISSVYIPQSSYTTGRASVTGNTITGSSTTHTYGGYNVNEPWANYEAYLWSTNAGEVAWYATAASKGDAFTGWTNLIKSACGKTVRTLVEDRVLQK